MSSWTFRTYGRLHLLCNWLMRRWRLSTIWLAPVACSSVIVNSRNLFGTPWRKTPKRWTYIPLPLCSFVSVTKRGIANFDWPAPSIVSDKNFDCSTKASSVFRIYSSLLWTTNWIYASFAFYSASVGSSLLIASIMAIRIHSQVTHLENRLKFRILTQFDWLPDLGEVQNGRYAFQWVEQPIFLGKHFICVILLAEWEVRFILILQHICTPKNLPAHKRNYSVPFTPLHVPTVFLPIRIFSPNLTNPWRLSLFFHSRRTWHGHYEVIWLTT